MTIGEREKEGEGGGFSRDECLVIAARGSTVPGNPRVPFVHPSPSRSEQRANWPRIGALPMHRCAPVDWTFRCGLETGRIPLLPFAVWHLYRWIRCRVCVCVCPNVHWLVSIALHRSFFDSSLFLSDGQFVIFLHPGSNVPFTLVFYL